MKRLLQALLADRDESSVETQVRISWDPRAPDPTPSDGAPLLPPRDLEPLALHPNARSNFDEMAETLVEALVTGPAEADAAPPVEPTRISEPFTSRLPDHAVPSGITLFRDLEGTTVARCFVHEGNIIGLQGEGYVALRRLAEGMQRTPALRSIVGVDVLEDLIFTWLRAYIIESAARAMSDEVLGRIADLVGSYEVALPLFRVQVPEPLQVGQVLLRTISASDFARWEAVATDAADAPERLDQLRFALVRERKRMQGFAAATVTLKGEVEHVSRIAREAAEEAVSLLRLFSPAILSPQARSFCALWGRESIECTTALVFSPERRSITFGEHLDTRQDFIWRITAERLRLIRAEVLDGLLATLYGSPENAFRDEVRSALVFYSQSALHANPVEKLLAALIPLESLLLHSSSEPISENLSTRLAFAIGESLPERKRIAEVTRTVYSMRSKYVHHRQRIEEIDALETLREFLQYAWRFFLGLALQAGQYRGREEYLKVLDDRKFA